MFTHLITSCQLFEYLYALIVVLYFLYVNNIFYFFIKSIHK
nr:MAG TPA: hypothetical protein [Caudoviricetes sp.]DAU54110.1 MAG TPA: hypothetical protein [Caudoviricetes sp.]DAX27171.1 MAG TPA: hypothetical protein [Caudoviricetes sp.]DAY46451.1 MAG TPA: hypothetical protein [Caudoviricetes sp.]